MVGAGRATIAPLTMPDMITREIVMGEEPKLWNAKLMVNRVAFVTLAKPEHVAHDKMICETSRVPVLWTVLLMTVTIWLPHGGEAVTQAAQFPPPMWTALRTAWL